MVQHHGVVPSPQDLERQRFRAADFIDSLAFSFFGRQLNELSRATLVRDKEVRDAIQAAEEKLAEGDSASAVGQLAIAFELARFAFRSEQPFDSRKSLAVHDVRRAMGEAKSGLQSFIGPGKRSYLRGLDGLERLLETLVRRSERAEDRLEALSLGAQASDYVWFRSRFPRAFLALGSDRWEVSASSGPPRVRFTHEEVLRGLDFVTTVALHWQQFPLAPSPDTDE